VEPYCDRVSASSASQVVVGVLALLGLGAVLVGLLLVLSRHLDVVGDLLRVGNPRQLLLAEVVVILRLLVVCLRFGPQLRGLQVVGAETTDLDTAVT
jgi:hypothetical protein